VPLSRAQIRRYRHTVVGRHRVRTKAAALRFVNAVGFCYAFTSGPGDLPALFDVLDTRSISRMWSWAWQWKDELASERHLFYGRIVRRKPTLISLAYVPHFFALTGNVGEPDDYLQAYREGRLGLLAGRIESATGFTAQSRERFSAEERGRVEDMSVELMQIMTFAAFLIGLAVIGLTLHAETLARLREIGVMKALGFPFDRGRFDESDHPFTEGVPGDIRVTAKFKAREPFQGLLGALHETGQALYDLGLPAEWVDQPVGQDRGMALEESQSLLLEMIVGRSRAFVTWLKPLLEKHYGAAGPEWSDENLYRHLNRVARGPNRMDADELTYQTHIGLRYELERRLLSGELAVRELRAAWNQLSADRLGLVPISDVEGCLQDIHWALGSFGHFPSYGVGAVIAGQLWESIKEHHPGVEAEIAAGQFGGLLTWLREKVHSMGAKLGVPQLVQHATGRPLSAAPFLRYLERKYVAEI